MDSNEKRIIDLVRFIKNVFIITNDSEDNLDSHTRIKFPENFKKDINNVKYFSNFKSIMRHFESDISEKK